MTTERAEPRDDAPPDGDVPRLPDPTASAAPLLAPPDLRMPTDQPPAAGRPVDPGPPGWTAESMQAVHRQTRSRTRGRQRSGRERATRAVVVLLGGAAALAILVGLGVALGVALRDPELPTFPTERPSYGVVELSFDEVDENGAASGGTLISDGRLENIDWDVESDLGDFVLRRTTSGTFVRTDGAWVAFEEDDEFRADLDAIALLPVFDDVVPAEARRFTRVVELEPDVLRGRDVTRLDLIIDDRRFESAERERFAQWARFMGDIEQPGGARSPGVGVTVWVGPDGVVWRFDSESEITSSRSTVDVVRIGDEDLTVEPPRNVAR